MMRSFFKTCGAYALGAAFAAGSLEAQDFRAPSMLTTPAARSYHAAPYLASANMRSVMAPTEQGPSIAPPEVPVPADAAPGAMPSQAIHGGYGYYGDQAPGHVYDGPGVIYDGGHANGAGCAASPAPEAAGSIVYEGCDGGFGMGGGFLGGLCRSGCRQSCWFGGVRGLIMDLDDGDDYGFSFEDQFFEPQLLRTDEIDMDWSGGVEVSVGRYFNCCQNALELTYWGVFSGAEQGQLNANQLQNDLGHTFTFNSLSFDPGGGVQAVDSWFQPAQAHRLTRDWEFHNVELNLLTLRNANIGGCGCGPALGLGRGCWDAAQPRFNVAWLAGFRYFRFDEDLQFASDIGDGVFNGGLDEMYYDIDAENNLYGFQLGADAELFLTRRLSVLGTTKFGVYENHIRQRQRVGNAGGVAFVNDPQSPNFGGQYDINTSEDTIAFLGELDLGGAFYLNSNLRLTGGYRVTVASGVARAREQMPYNFDDLLGASDPNDHGTMYLHGAYAGVEFNY